MSVLIKTVDKTSVTFEDTFKYTINVSFNGIVGEINSAKITDFFPDYLSYVLPSSIPFVENIIEEEVEGGTLVTFDFGSIEDLGISVTININCKFILGTDSLTIFENTSDMYINNSLYTSSTAQIVTLNVVEDFIIEKDIPVPNNRLGTPGGRVIFSICLKNKLKSHGGSGDPGAKIINIEITDLIPPGFTLDSNYPVRGRDVSPSSFADTRYDGQLAIVTGNNIVFSLPEYYGICYRILCVCNISEDISTDQLSNTANLYIDNINRGSSTSTLNIGNPIYTGNIVKYGPNYGSVGNYISFDLSVGNYGNIDLLNFTIEDKIPDEVTPYRINTGSFQLDVIYIPTPQPYAIEYSINNQEPYILLGTYDASISEYVTLPTLPEGEKITKIRWTIPNMAVGMISNSKISIDGIINSSGENDTFTNIGEITYEDSTGTNIVQATHITNLNNKSELNLTKSRITNKSSFIPGDIIRYSLKFTGTGSQINNPVVSDLLPEKLEYLGSEKYTFYDYFNETTIDSTNPNFYDLVPLTKEVEENYNNTNSTLVTYNFEGFSLRQKGYLTIEVDTKIKVGAIGNISNFAVIGNKGDNGIVGPGGIPYLDLDDRDKDNITDETILRSNNNITIISYSNALSSDKKVKGALDEYYTEEPSIGLTCESGAVNYKIAISNMGNLPYNYIQIVDILPHIGDTGVISTDIDRLSQFPVYITNDIVGHIVENNIILSSVNLLIEYSQSYDPLRFGSSNFGDDTIGTDNDWTTIPPSDITSIKSIKITLDNYLLQPNQSIIVDLVGIAPFGVTENLVAWNSIAVKATYLDESNVTQKILPVEPEKVGVKVINTNMSKISGKTWIDFNKNGNIDPGELMLNGVIIQLLSSNMTVLDETVTTNNLNNEPGYYMFNNLNPGDYYIKFIAPNSMYFTLQNENTQNKADSSTGLTSKYTISDDIINITDIDGGLIEGLDLIILLLDLLNDSIYSMNCNSKNLIIQQIQYNNDQLANIIILIIEYFQLELNSSYITDEGYKAQIQRLISILENILFALNNIVIPVNFCNKNLLSHIILANVDSIINLIKLLEENKALIGSYNNCQCLKLNLFNIIIIDFINNITTLESLISDFYNIVYALNMDTNTMSNNYIASYLPRSKIIVRPYHQNKTHFCPPHNPRNIIKK